jgi:hypothetical protein
MSMWRSRDKIKVIDGMYSVGSDGTVYSGGLPLSPIRGAWVSLHGKRRLVSYLVARAFVPNQEGRMYVIHKNGDKKDNRASNLAWSDAEEEKGKRGPKPRLVPIVQYDRNGERVAVYGSIIEAAEKSGLRADLIRAALQRRKGQTGGFFWMYL